MHFFHIECYFLGYSYIVKKERREFRPILKRKNRWIGLMWGIKYEE